MTKKGLFSNMYKNTEEKNNYILKFKLNILHKGLYTYIYILASDNFKIGILNASFLVVFLIHIYRYFNSKLHCSRVLTFYRPLFPDENTKLKN